MQQQEYIFVGIWRDQAWSVQLAETVTAEDLADVDVAQHLRTTVVIGRDHPQATLQLANEAEEGVDPFAALRLDGHESSGLKLVRDHVQRATPLADPRSSAARRPFKVSR
jgi:hypothetical protein